MRDLFRAALTASFIALGSASAFAWGAIAVDDDMGDDPEEVGYAFVTDSPTAAAARAEAMQTCIDSGNTSCRVVLTFPKCGAYAASTMEQGVGAAATQRAAEQRALADCGSRDCRIVVSDCH